MKSLNLSGHRKYLLVAQRGSVCHAYGLPASLSADATNPSSEADMGIPDGAEVLPVLGI
ncbi:hypothetical protein [Rhizobium sp. BK456]|uniref:hypothetical protein n=1 Tax=Rhizobium sp. BK456 TaxID=2587007 RepID=UPI0016227E50|nr:hypothetical protein [Rhizobium sp. BK456]MBB3524834.1 hypothetical protein [Rhizobium sp. BK456]